MFWRCQWVLGHLTDDHLVEFFKRCVKGLKSNGVIVVKENLTSGEEVEMDEEDSSVTRPEELVKQIFQRAGLIIIMELKQQKMPKGLYPVKMFVLRNGLNNWIKCMYWNIMVFLFIFLESHGILININWTVTSIKFLI